MKTNKVNFTGNLFIKGYMSQRMPAEQKLADILKFNKIEYKIKDIDNFTTLIATDTDVSKVDKTIKEFNEYKHNLITNFLEFTYPKDMHKMMIKEIENFKEDIFEIAELVMAKNKIKLKNKPVTFDAKEIDKALKSNKTKTFIF